MNRDNEQRRLRELKKIAAVNLKKTSGGHTSNNGEIYRAAVDHYDIIKEQIDLYKADFIICCGTEYAFMDACYKDREVDWKMTSRGIWYFRDGKSVVISFSHPEARVKDAYVMLFRTMFGHAKEDVFGFHQLSHSVIILDEIQSYKNELWGEIITFLKGFAELMQMKIIIMSATLPNLDILTDNHCQTIRLIENREKYFNHPKFARRVVADYSLLEQKMTMEYLTDEIVKKAGKNKKVLIEFIRKRSAEECYRILCEKSEIPVFLMTGDSSILDRKRMIRKIEALDSVILVATQVVEAGVDIDMDIGYKDISRLDSEEQFMGRINRSGRKSGIVYFFDLDNAEKIYSGDKRIEKDKTLVNKEMRELLTAKNFPAYYENGILPLVLAEKKKCNDENIEDFFQKTVGNLDMPKVDKRMQLINDNRLMKSVYLGRIIQEENGEEIDGRFVWDEYKQLIEETEMEYSERKVKQVNYCVLNEEGRKIFIESFEERLESVFMHPKLKRKVSYRTALKLDCYKLIKNILEEKEFVSFSLKEGM